MQKVWAVTGFSINLFHVVIASFTGAPHRGSTLAKTVASRVSVNVGRAGNAGVDENIRRNRFPL